MGKVVVIEHLTLDGVMQAPGRPDEDTRGGFEHGGWAVPYSSDAMGRLMSDRPDRPSAMLFGRRTYEEFAGFWPAQPANPVTEALNKTQKYVASTTLTEPLPWENSTVLSGEAADAVAALKRDQPEQDLVVLGSGALIRSLLPRNLIDEFKLLIHPLSLGSGGRLFPDGEVTTLQLVDAVSTSTGVVICTYRPAGD